MSTFIKQKVKSEDDYSYIEKLARPKKPFKEYDHFLTSEDNECVFAPDITTTQKKCSIAGKFTDRYKAYVQKYEGARTQIKVDPECTHTPSIRLGAYKDAVLGRGPLVERMMRDAKLRKQLQETRVAALDEAAGGCTFEPNLVAKAKSDRIITKNKDLQKSFLQRVEDDQDKRMEKRIIRQVRAENPPELTFKPRLIAIGSEEVVKKRGTFMERMAADTRQRELKLLYRAKLFGLPHPMQKRNAGEDAAPATARRASTRKGKGPRTKQGRGGKARSKTRK